MTTGITWLDPIIVWLSATSFVLGTVALIVRRVRPFVRDIAQFLDDWKGEPARPGVRARPGVMSRLDTIEHELHPNNGLSLRDAVDRLERQAATPTLNVHVNPPTPPTES